MLNVLPDSNPYTYLRLHVLFPKSIARLHVFRGKSHFNFVVRDCIRICSGDLEVTTSVDPELSVSSSAFNSWRLRCAIAGNRKS